MMAASLAPLLSRSLTPSHRWQYRTLHVYPKPTTAKTLGRQRATRMTTIHVQRVGDKAILPQSEFEQLVELARQQEEIAVQMHEDDVPTLGIMRLAEQGGAFDFWKEAGEDIYSAEDGE